MAPALRADVGCEEAVWQSALWLLVPLAFTEIEQTLTDWLDTWVFAEVMDSAVMPNVENEVGEIWALDGVLAVLSKIESLSWYLKMPNLKK